MRCPRTSAELPSRKLLDRRRVLAGVLEVHGDGQRVAEHELRRERRDLVAELAVRPGPVLSLPDGIEERVEELAERVLALAAAVLHDAAHADRPTRRAARSKGAGLRAAVCR